MIRRSAGRTRRCLGALAIAVSAATPLLPSGTSLARAADADPLVAIVNGTEIRESDLRFAEQDMGGKPLPPDEQAKRDYLIKFLIDINVLSNSATKQHISEDAELQRRTNFVRKKVLTEKLMQMTAEKAVTEQALRSAYDEMVRKLPPEPELHLHSIMFKFSSPSEQSEVETAKAKAVDALKRIKGGQDFATVAAAMSGGNANVVSSDLGYLKRAELGKEYAEVAFTLAKGEVSAPIMTSFGWHIIKIEDTRMSKPRDFESTRESFQSYLGRKAQFELVQKLRSEAKIEYVKSDSAPEPAKFVK